jgi:hypothetical protein
MRFRLPILIAVLIAAAPVLAAPDLRQPTDAGPLRVFPDDRRSSLYYYLPGELRVATDEDGRPDAQLFEVRYLGTAAAGDQGESLFRSLFSFQVVMDGPDSKEIGEARKALAALRKRGSVELRPLPVDRLESALVWAPVVPLERSDAPEVLPGGHFEAEDTEGKSSNRSFWTRRSYTVPLDVHSAQLLRTALQEGQVLVSLGYAFYCVGIGPDEPIEVLSGTPALVREIEKRAGRSEKSPGEKDGRVGVHLVRAGATSVTVDAARWPELLKRVDVNERIPPAYALLGVYCYDFREGLRPDLYLKRVQIEARGVAGDPVSREVVFERSSPDLYTHSLRFPFAVRLDRPYRYRVIEVSEDGRVMEGSWVEVESWVRPLDVTSAPPAEGEGDEDD